jgi:pyrroline-5-carboxylate reductase
MQAQTLPKIGFIGGGNMAHALIVGLKHQQYNASDITVIELDAQRRDQLAKQLGVNVTESLADLQDCAIIVLAVKPQQLKAVAQNLSTLLSHQLVVSIAAGIRTHDLSRWLNNYKTIVRAMPNTPAQIQAGITGLYAMSGVSAQQQSLAAQLLNAAGETIWVDSERALDAVTAISGSGPAYVFYLMEGLQSAAEALGLTPAQAKQLSLATFKGASLLAASSNTPVETLRAQVTSKGGTTEQGILSLERDNVKQVLINAAMQADKRAQEMGDQLGSM